MKRIGFGFWVHTPYETLIAGAKEAEDRGFESVWSTEAPMHRDVFSLLSATAASTNRIGLGTGVVNIFTRTPILLALSAATVDLISQGRMILGLGTGHKPVIEGGHGLRFSEPIQRMRETTAIIRRCLEKGRLSYRGKIFDIPKFEMRFEPTRKEIPIYIGALGHRMIGLAGRIGDGVLLNNISTEYARKVIPMALALSQKQRRTPRELDVAAFHLTCVSRNGNEAKKKAKKVLAFYASQPFYQRHFSRLGFSREVLLIQDAWNRHQPAEAEKNVSDAMVDSLAIAGDAEECRTRLEEYRSAGVQLPIIFAYTPNPGRRIDWILEAIRAFAP